jgi:hypothetical protein
MQPAERPSARPGQRPHADYGEALTAECRECPSAEDYVRTEVPTATLTAEAAAYWRLATHWDHVSIKTRGDTEAHTQAGTEMAVAIVMAGHKEVTLSRSTPQTDRDALALAVVAHKHAHLVDPGTEPDWLAWQDTMVVRRALHSLVLYLEGRSGVPVDVLGLDFFRHPGAMPAAPAKPSAPAMPRGVAFPPRLSVPA